MLPSLSFFGNFGNFYKQRTFSGSFGCYTQRVSRDRKGPEAYWLSCLASCHSKRAPAHVTRPCWRSEKGKHESDTLQLCCMDLMMAGSFNAWMVETCYETKVMCGLVCSGSCDLGRHEAAGGQAPARLAGLPGSRGAPAHRRTPGCPAGATAGQHACPRGPGCSNAALVGLLWSCASFWSCLLCAQDTTWTPLKFGCKA